MPDQKEKKQCFVISPIGAEGSEIRDHADAVLHYIIVPAMKQCGINAQRSDKMYESGRISKQMFRSIMDADLCIAVLTYHNPNVFYELAVAQSFARPVILLLEEGTPLPFDIKDLRTISYKLQPIIQLVDKKKYSKEVVKHVRDIERLNWTVPSLIEQYSIPPAKYSTERQFKKMVLNSHPEPLQTMGDNFEHTSYSIVGCEGQIIIRQGDLGKILKFKDNIDVVVNLVDTYLQLERYFDTSISGILRYYDAKCPKQKYLKDILHEELQRKVPQKDLPVEAGSVWETLIKSSHGLAQYKVKYIFHVAAMQKKGGVGEGYHMMDQLLDNCVGHVFDKFDELAATDKKLKTILFPMLGAGTTRLSINEVVRMLLQTIVERMKEDNSRCQKTYLLVWLESHHHAVTQVAKEMGLQLHMQNK